ncbi:MAG: DoxX family protein [Chthoniobacteraceae bacterium]|jgi:putative oxidoreductase
MKRLLQLAATGYGWLITGASCLQPVFLLIIRLYWGWQFHVTGMGKLMNLDRVAGYFQSLGIPFPAFNAHLAGLTECFGGLFLLAGIFSRITSIPLIVTMIVAYNTAFPDAVKHIFSKPDDFVSADPFQFMLAAIIIFIFGPGLFSVDGLVGWILKRRAAKRAAAASASEAPVSPA